MPAYDEPPWVSGVLDRDAATRLSESALDAAWETPTTLLLRINDGRLPMGPAGLDLQRVRGERQSQHLYLGRAEGVAVFAAEAHDDDGYEDPQAGWGFAFQCAESLNPLHRELLGVALALGNWHRAMQFSPIDGSPTTVAQGGWMRLDEKGREHFPRTDPAVIVLVEHEHRLLLGSNVLWEQGRFSLLAGFVEAGESAEQAVKREVYEEAGVVVDNVRYVVSQPWPFPRSLMLGFRATLAQGSDPQALVADAAEISALRWFSRQELREPSPDLLLPGKLSVARWLIDLWISEGDHER